MSHRKVTLDCDRHRDVIYTLYVIDKLPLEGPDGIMKVMRERLGFDAP
jgi:hypothetical protein